MGTTKVLKHYPDILKDIIRRTANLPVVVLSAFCRSMFPVITGNQMTVKPGTTMFARKNYSGPQKARNWRYYIADRTGIRRITDTGFI